MYLQRQLTKDFAPGIRQRGYGLFTSRLVTLLSGNQWEVSARVGVSNVQRVQLSRQDDELYVFCDCPFFETESAFKHIWATIVAADDKHYLRGAGGGIRPSRRRPSTARTALDNRGRSSPTG